MNRGPAWDASREKPLVHPYKGKVFRAWPHLHRAAQHVRWTVAVDDSEMDGWEARPDETDDQVRAAIERWWDSRA